MIQISGLNKEQVEMLDYMWHQLDTEDDYLVWYMSLDSRQQKMAETLMRMVIIETCDAEEDLGEMAEAKEVLEKFTK